MIMTNIVKKDGPLFQFINKKGILSLKSFKIKKTNFFLLFCDVKLNFVRQEKNNIDNSAFV